MGDHWTNIRSLFKILNRTCVKKRLKRIKSSRRSQLKLDYLYLKNRLTAIEKAIKHFLGPGQMKHIRLLYEQEMTQRILTAREHT